MLAKLNALADSHVQVASKPIVLRRVRIRRGIARSRSSRGTPMVLMYHIYTAFIDYYEAT